MYTAILSVFVIIAIVLIVLVLVQQGKGADMGASFGAGASGTLFGSSGTGDFLSKATWVFMIAFFAICIVIANLSKPTSSGAYDDFSAVEVQKNVTESTQSIGSMIPSNDSVKTTPATETNTKTSIQDQVN